MVFSGQWVRTIRSQKWIQQSRSIEHRNALLFSCGVATATVALYHVSTFAKYPRKITQNFSAIKDENGNAGTFRSNLDLIAKASAFSAFSQQPRTSSCEGLLYTETDFPDGYSEADRFKDVLRFHRSLLSDYIERWVLKSQSNNSSVAWPRNVPNADEIASLEMDYSFCQRSPNYRDSTQACQDLQFRIGSYYLASEDPDRQKKGFGLIKDLAERGHADGMCYYGILLNQGAIEGVDANPELAVVWWRRCVDFHRHIWAAYEMGVAFYTGEGVPENVDLASKFFRHAAHFGHAGAAYVLGDMLLNGVGVERDRATALEWLVTAAELGHPLAQERVIIVIQQEEEALEKGKSPVRHETLKWAKKPGREVLIERKYTVGGGPRNPTVLQRRKTVVKESVQNKGHA